MPYYKEQQGLNWRNDPLLFDPEVQPSDSWLAANDLIEAKQRTRIFLKDNCLNIYPIIIRRIDFVRRAPGDRILSRFPYAILSPEEREAIQKKALLIAECCRNFFYRSIDSPIKSWQGRLHHYLERGAIPYPLLRCAAEVCYSESIDLGRSKTGALFESAKREKFTLPLQLSEDLAYLCGVVDGDGHLDQKGVTIVDSSQEHIINLRRLFEKQFGSYAHRYHSRVVGDHGHTLIIRGKWLVRLFNFLTGHKIGGKKYDSLREPLLFKDNPLLQRSYWSGLMDADGSYKSNISFCSSSGELRKDFCSFLEEQNIGWYERESWGVGAKSYSIYVQPESRQDFARLIQTWHPQKKEDLQILLQRKVIRPRSAANRHNGSWSGQVIGFNEETLIKGYFDFSLLPKLGVPNIGSLIRSIRQKANRRQATFLPNLSQVIISHYERDTIAIPISILEKILSLYLSNERGYLMSFLEEHGLTHFQIKKARARLDLKPNQHLLRILRGLQLRSNYFLIVGTPEASAEKYRMELEDYFSIGSSVSPTATHFYNSVLKTYVRKFMLLRE